jgi:hypothetical protein
VTWPDTLTINAYLGDGRPGAASPVAPKADAWTLRHEPPVARAFLKPKPIDETRWDDPRVGWGLILPERPGLTPAQLATADDSPEPIRELVRQRQGPVFRFRPESAHRTRLLRSYGAGMDVAINGAPWGTALGAMPRYLLIYGTPEEIPWELQYVLNGACQVGRLDLAGMALERYVTALLEGWRDAPAQVDRTVVWAVDHHPTDITHLMRDVVADGLYRRLHDDEHLGPHAVFLDGAQGATAARLAATLAADRPGLVVTASHGQTYPLDDREQMAAALGLPVDQTHASVTPEALLEGWQPGGAVWYAHACCSAGSDAQTIFDGLVPAGSPVDQVLKGVAALGARVAPLPRALLGAPQPLRAFVGHVEPTFDWTLREPTTRQPLSDALVTAFYQELYQPVPVGYALRRHYDRLKALYTAYDADRRRFNEGADTRGLLLRSLLTARDVQSLVILGDPTVTLPAL